MPPLRGMLLALASALAFGLATPLVQRLTRDGAAGPFATAMLLYAGAAVVGLVSRSRAEASVARGDAPRIAVVAVLGALFAPALLTWGLARTSGTSAALMLNLEALFTIGLARAVHHEHVSRRVALAAAVLLAGGALLVVDRARDAAAGASGAVSVFGLVAVAGAALFWAFDNTVSRALSEIDPSSVVAAKGALGAALSLVAALLLGDAWPSSRAIVLLVLVGGLGYGASLRLYLLAQRAIGAGRTASVFASGPFWGAGVAWLLGEPAGLLTLIALAVMLAGVAIHLTERHGHSHVHEATEHEHPHAHDDGHHDHGHDPLPVGEHTHRHRHGRIVHDHAHLPDVHHAHVHDDDS